jgi:signal transduction histidine kinase
MFISNKRYRREVQALQSAGNRLTEAILHHVSQGVFFLDQKDKVILPVSRSMSALFRRRDWNQVTFDKLLRPLVAEETLAEACAQLAELRVATARGDLSMSTPLQEVELHLPKTDGGVDVAHYAFDFFPVDVPGQVDAWMVRVTDRTIAVKQTRELEQLRPQVEGAAPELQDLRAQLQLQGEILHSLLQMGRVRFAASVQRSGEALKAINAILKKPAREENAFRQKLEETLAEVEHIRREASGLRLTGLENAAQQFEDSLQQLRSRSTLSGNDFIPLAMLLDQLFGQFTLLRSLTQSAAAPRPVATAPASVPMTDNGTEILAAPQFLAQQAPAGSLENTLVALTEHIAAEYGKSVRLDCRGLQKVPATYQAAVKNIAIQLIRNAVMHGIETPAEREQAGKPPQGALELQFGALPDGTFDLRFQDDGRGVDPALVRRIAIERGLITADVAQRLRDRQTIKLIFKDGFTSLASAGTGTDPDGAAHGAGLSLVRRYVHDAGGKVALASDPGKETRFKVSLPEIVKDAAPKQAEVA